MNENETTLPVEDAPDVESLRAANDDLIGGLAAAYKPDGDLALFFADQSTLYVKQRVSGQWQARAAWDKTTGTLSGVACACDGDWDLLVTGVDVVAPRDAGRRPRRRRFFLCSAVPRCP